MDELGVGLGEPETGAADGAVVFEVRGMPHPQPRPRFVGPGRVVSTAGKAVKLWRAAVVAAARQARAERGACPKGAALAVSMVFTFPSSESERWGRAHLSRPDIDNLGKLVADCLMEAGLIHDDALIFALVARKVWGATGGVVVRLDAVGAKSEGVFGEVGSGLEGARLSVSGVSGAPSALVVPDWLR